MKKLLFPAAALAILMAAPAAYAADQDGPNKPRQERANRASDDRPAPAARMNGPGGATVSPNAMRGPNADRPNADRAGGNDRNRNDNDRTVIKNNNNRTVIKNKDNDRTVIRNKTVVRKVVKRADVLKFRANIRAPRRFHAGVYVRPTGWYSHRWVYGERLPRNFFARNYWLLDFAAYGLIAPWDGYEWVRYGNDALLIDVENRRSDPRRIRRLLLIPGDRRGA